jgi:hypothetical protein
MRPGYPTPDPAAAAAAAEPGPVLAVERRVVVAPGLVQSVFCQVGRQQRDGVAGQGDVAGLAALAGQRGDSRVLETDVADGEVGEFPDPASWRGWR